MFIIVPHPHLQNLIFVLSSQAVADANRQKAVLEIKIQENIIEVEGKKNVSLINNEILQVLFFEWDLLSRLALYLEIACDNMAHI